MMYPRENIHLKLNNGGIDMSTTCLSCGKKIGFISNVISAKHKEGSICNDCADYLTKLTSLYYKTPNCYSGQQLRNGMAHKVEMVKYINGLIENVSKYQDLINQYKAEKTKHEQEIAEIKKDIEKNRTLLKKELMEAETRFNREELSDLKELKAEYAREKRLGHSLEAGNLASLIRQTEELLEHDKQGITDIYENLIKGDKLIIKAIEAEIDGCKDNISLYESVLKTERYIYIKTNFPTESYIFGGVGIETEEGKSEVISCIKEIINTYCFAVDVRFNELSESERNKLQQRHDLLYTFYLQSNELTIKETARNRTLTAHCNKIMYDIELYEDMLEDATDEKKIEAELENAEKILAQLELAFDASSNLLEDMDLQLCEIAPQWETIMETNYNEKTFCAEENSIVNDVDEPYEFTCPKCSKNIVVELSVIAAGSMLCPNCGEKLEFDFDDEDEETPSDLQAIDSFEPNENTNNELVQEETFPKTDVISNLITVLQNIANTKKLTEDVEEFVRVTDKITEATNEKTNNYTEHIKNDFVIMAPSETFLEDTQIKLCPACQKENKSTARFCKYCGESLEPIRFCEDCGAKLKPGKKFCSQCGAKIE